MIQYHLDEHVHLEVANALRRRGVDVTTAAEAGLLAASDVEQLAFATRAGRVLFTNDADFLRMASQDSQHSGIAYCQRDRRTIGQIVASLELMYHTLTDEQMRGRVEYL